MSRWQKPKAKSPQQSLLLQERGAFTPALKKATDTSVEAAREMGLHRAGDLATSMLGVMERQSAKKRLAGVMKAITVRKEVLDYLKENRAGATADAIAYALKYSILTVRPRVSELRRLGTIVDSGRRGANASGHNAIVWIAAQEELI